MKSPGGVFGQLHDERANFATTKEQENLENFAPEMYEFQSACDLHRKLEESAFDTDMIVQNVQRKHKKPIMAMKVLFDAFL